MNRWTTIWMCIVSGAIAGVVVAALSIVFELGIEICYTRMSLEDYLAIEPIWQRAWQCVDMRFAGFPMTGAIGGFVTSFLAKPTRRPILLAVVWASILGSVVLLLAAMIHILESSPARPVEVAVIVCVCLGQGAAFGFTLGLIAHFLESKLCRKSE